jgi:integrase
MMSFKLPDNVRPIKDRHGRTRYRFRKKGYKSAYIHGKPGTREFYASLAEAVEQRVEGSAVASPLKIEPKSLDDLYRRMKRTPEWKQKTTKAAQARVYERFLNRVASNGKRYGEKPVESVTVAWLNRILGDMAETPGAANDLRKKLTVLLEYAIDIDWLDRNPARRSMKYKKTKPIYTWTEDDIAQFRATHALGTMARLTLELALNTAARRCNVAELTRDDIKGGRIVTHHAKGNNEASVTLLPMTRDALEALPAAPIKHLVVTQFGKPFTVNGLGNRMRKWCDEAGLPQCSLHGLRKAISRRIAESGATDAQGQAVTGHTKPETFQKYRATANRITLADDALSNVALRFDVQPAKSDGNADT